MTTATFWLGNPSEGGARFLGAVSSGGYPEPPGLTEFADVQIEQGFRDRVNNLCSRRDFFAPGNAFPFQWKDDIFLTNYCYAFFGGKLWIAAFGHRFVSYGVACTLDYLQEGDILEHLRVPFGFATGGE